MSVKQTTLGFSAQPHG